MNYKIIKKLPSINDIASSIPLSETARDAIAQHRQEIVHILTGQDARWLMIIGPCSAWPAPAVLDYAEKLAVLNEKVRHAIKIVMRVYTQKPRTIKGWMGPLYQPDPLASPDIEAGIRYSRQMQVAVAEMGLPLAAEALFTQYQKGFVDLLSWVAIGARSSESQEHRIFASALDIPVGLKNPTNGSLMAGMNSIIAAQHAHTAIFDEHEVQTAGNPYAHLVLRGGECAPNYSVNHLEMTYQYMQKHRIQHPAVIIDVNHDNAISHGKKDHRLQPNIIFDVLNNLNKHAHLKNLVKGFMVESFLKEGHQKIDSGSSLDLGGLSITDPCLGWEETEALLLKLAMTACGS